MVNTVSTRLFKLAVVACCVLATSTSYADNFGSGGNSFDIEFVTIGNPGNPADTTGSPNPAGSVDYSYRMGKFEISEDMIDKANTLDGLGIIKDTRGADKPATSVSWNEAARFVNWLNTSSGGFAAYNFTTGGVNDNIALWTPADTLDYNAANPFRSKRTKYVLPSMDEWYKAAYYNPTTGLYRDYPSLNGLVPAAVANGTDPNTAVYLQPFAQGPADITQAGGLSAYGTMGQGGNVAEWEESAFNLVNNSSSSTRGVRGGDWNDNSDNLQSSSRNDGFFPDLESGDVGFRVASSVPEPSSLLLGALVGVGLLVRRRR